MMFIHIFHAGLNGRFAFTFFCEDFSWNVIMMICGTMGIVFLLIKSKMPALLADLIIDRMPNVKWATEPMD